MRVQAISKVSYQAKDVQKQAVKRSEQVVNLNFKGIKGGTKGALVGAGAATLLSLLTPFGLAILPLWVAGGAIAGHTNEEDNNKELEEENDKKNK